MNTALRGLNRLAYEDVANNYESLCDHARRIKELEKTVEALKENQKILIHAARESARYCK